MSFLVLCSSPNLLFTFLLLSLNHKFVPSFVFSILYCSSHYVCKLKIYFFLTLFIYRIISFLIVSCYGTYQVVLQSLLIIISTKYFHVSNNFLFSNHLFIKPTPKFCSLFLYWFFLLTDFSFSVMHFS